MQFKAECALEDVVPAVVEAFNKDLEETKKVYENAEATEVNIDEAFKILTNVIHMLEFKQGDKETLINLVEMAEALNKEIYTSSSWVNLIAELAKVNAVIEDENAMQEDVNETIRSLENAKNNLVGKSDNNSNEESNSGTTGSSNNGNSNNDNNGKLPKIG